MRTSALLFTENGCPTERLARLLRDLQIPGTTLPEIDDELQQRFFQKKDTGEARERWELEKVLITCPEHTILEQLGRLGFMYRTEPERDDYDRAAWPGALVIRAAGRLCDLVDAWEDGVRWKETIVFGGKRPLVPLKENVVKCCEALGIPVEEDTQAREYVRLWDRINPETELDMMRFLWEAASLDDPYPGALALPLELRKVFIDFVDAPMKPPAIAGGNPVRPNTEDTILAWLNGDPPPQPGSMLVSSGAPYGMAQNEAFWMLLGPKGHAVETFGHAAPAELGIELLLRELAGTVNRIRRARGA